MKNKKTNRRFGVWASGALLALGYTACSSEMPQTGAGADEAVRIASVSEVTPTIGAGATTTLVPADGSYYLGYQTEVGGAPSYPVRAVEVAGGTIAETGLYWASVQPDETGNKAFFTLSNVGVEGQGAMQYPAGDDIVWGSCTAWMAPLNFTLSHRMAAVKVELELDLSPSASIEQVTLAAIRRGYDFDRQTGLVSVSGASAEWTLEPASATSGTDWEGLLPPQNRTDAMELRVTTLDGTLRRVYKRTLPYSMIEAIGSDQSQSIPLVFRAGYRLLLTAKVTDNTDYTVFFTGATLVDWEYKGLHGVVGKPAGIYTETELKDWTQKYNAYQADKSEKNRKALLRYGTFEAATAQWTFTLSRNIPVSNKNNLTPVTLFRDRFDRLNTYQITGIEQQDLFTAFATGASVTAGIF